MTREVVLGDLLDTAREQINLAGRVAGRPRAGRDLLDVSRSMHAVISAVGGYLQDFTTKGDPSQAGPWPMALAQARRAAANAARHLQPRYSARRSGALAASARGRHLGAAAAALQAGRDLLATHATSGPEARRVGSSPWEPIIASPEFSHALAAELASLSRQVAALGTGLVMTASPTWEESNPARRDMLYACQYLRLMCVAILAAHSLEPVTTEDRERLRAVPIGLMPPRLLPAGGESLSDLCDGVVRSAHRLSRSAQIALARAEWLPEVNVDSLRQAAEAGVVASHNIGIVLHALAQRSSEECDDAWAGFGSAREAAQASWQSRDSWLLIHRALRPVVSDVPVHRSAETIDALDLALWTGQLAYTDPHWTTATGPRSPERPPSDLAPKPDDARRALTAAHHASDSLLKLAAVNADQARAVAHAERFLVQTRSLPENYDVPLPYGPATPDRIAVVLSTYRSVREASAEAAAAVAHAANEARSPSRILPLAGISATAVRSSHNRASRDGQPEETAVYEPRAVPGPVERTLQLLGATGAEHLARAADIDRMGEELVIEACTQGELAARRPAEHGIGAGTDRRRTSLRSERKQLEPGHG